jgi:hypothetical protein
VEREQGLRVLHKLLLQIASFEVDTHALRIVLPERELDCTPE